MGIAGKTLNDQSVAYVSKRGAEATKRVGIRLSAEEAGILGQYASFLSRERLSPKLYCQDCGPDCEVEVNINPVVIGVICDHRMLFYDGPVAVTETMHREEPRQLVTLARIGVPERALSDADAMLMRQYQKFLRAYGLQEAMWCLKCEQENRPAGMKVYVRPEVISMQCRCANRVSTGMTIQ